MSDDYWVLYYAKQKACDPIIYGGLAWLGSAIMMVDVHRLHTMKVLPARMAWGWTFAWSGSMLATFSGYENWWAASQKLDIWQAAAKKRMH